MQRRQPGRSGRQVQAGEVRAIGASNIEAPRLALVAATALRPDAIAIAIADIGPASA